MAKRTRKTTHRKWKAHPNDAIKLAALRWLACRIEMEAIQIYATNSARYADIEAALVACVDTIHGLKQDIALGEDAECPPGYVLCRNECAPMCDELE
jgi:hypothetical protein